MEYNRVALKQAAKEALRHPVPRAWKVTLFYVFIVGLVSFVLSLLSPNRTLEILSVAQSGNLSEHELLQLLQQVSSDGPLQFLLSVLSMAVSSVLGYGYSAYALKIWRGHPSGYADIFSGFRMFLRVIGAAFMVWLFTFLWLLLALIPVFILVIPIALAESRALLALYFILVFFGIFAFTMWITLRYAMVPYWIISDERCGVFEAIERSKECMRGNKGKLFVLQLSFIGWFLLIVLGIYALLFTGVLLGTLQGGYTSPVMMGSLFAGIGLLLTVPLILWLTPYYSVATMGFFDLLAAASAPPSAPPPSGSMPYSDVPPVLNSDQAPPPRSTYVQQPPEEPGLAGTDDPWNLS